MDLQAARRLVAPRKAENDKSEGPASTTVHREHTNGARVPHEFGADHD